MVVVFGKNGQVATGLRFLAPHFSYFSSKEAPFIQIEKPLEILELNRPQVVVNAAAYTAVDRAESEKDLALEVNAHAVGHIAKWCADNDATLIHYSTDYVFDGSGERPWVETDLPKPVNWYGHTKFEGEKLILQSSCRHYIFRVSWIYSPWGQNFVKTIRKLALEREELKIVSDQWGAPTKAQDIAQTTVNLIEKLSTKNPETPLPGLYHLQFEPHTNWHQFAQKIISEAKAEGLPVVTKSILPVSSEEYPTAAKRPKNSRLKTLYPEYFGCL